MSAALKRIESAIEENYGHEDVEELAEQLERTDKS